MTTKEEREQLRAQLKSGVKTPAIPARPMTANKAPDSEPLVKEPSAKSAEAATSVQGPRASLLAAAKSGLPAREMSSLLEDAPVSDLDTPIFDKPKHSPPQLPSRAMAVEPEQEVTTSQIESVIVSQPGSEAPVQEKFYDSTPVLPPVAESIVQPSAPSIGGSARKPSESMGKLKAFVKKYWTIPALTAAFLAGMLVDCNCRGPKVVEKVVVTKCVKTEPVKITPPIPEPKPVEPKKEEPKCGNGKVEFGEQCEPKPNSGETAKCKKGSVCSKSDCMCKKSAAQSTIQSPKPPTSCLVKTAGPAAYASRHFDVRDFLNTSAASLQSQIGDERLTAVTALCKANGQAVVISVKGQNDNDALYRKVKATLNASLEGKKFVIVEGQPVVKVNIPIKVF